MRLFALNYNNYTLTKMKFSTLVLLIASVSAVQLEGPKGKGKKSAGKKGGLDYTHGELPSGMLAPGYAAPEQVLQMDPKRGKFATTFYA